MSILDIVEGYTTIIIVIVTTLVYLYWSTRRPPGIPPGPTPLPIVGNITSLLEADTRVAFAKLRKQYGDVFGLCIGNGLLIVVNGMDALKEMFVKNGDVFSERPKLGYSELTKGFGIINANGEGWKEQRRFTLSTFRDLGMGRGKMEDRIANECQVCLDQFSEKGGKPFDPNHVIATSVCNVTCLVMFGKSYKHDDLFFQNYLKTINESAKKVGNTSFIHFFPILSYFVSRSLKNTDDLIKNSLLKQEVERHVEDTDENEQRDFVDAYLKEIKRTENEELKNSFHIENLMQILGEFFFAGTETTTTTLRWAILYLSLYPHHQRAVQEEIDGVIGRDRRPTSSDRKSLPLLEATMMEVQRIGDVVPFAVPHGSVEETTFKGYSIPPSAIILPNLSSVLQDRDIWGDPEVFRPDRFLDSNGKVVKSEALAPFSLGKRICLGESLARMELFMFLTMMLQSFTFSLPETEPAPSLRGVIGITRMPNPYNIIATKR